MRTISVLPSHAEWELDGELQTLHHSTRVRLPAQCNHYKIHNAPPPSPYSEMYHCRKNNVWHINYSCFDTEVSLCRGFTHPNVAQYADTHRPTQPDPQAMESQMNVSDFHPLWVAFCPSWERMVYILNVF